MLKIRSDPKRRIRDFVLNSSLLLMEYTILFNIVTLSNYWLIATSKLLHKVLVTKWWFQKYFIKYFYECILFEIRWFLKSNLMCICMRCTTVIREWFVDSACRRWEGDMGLSRWRANTLPPSLSWETDTSKSTGGTYLSDTQAVVQRSVSASTDSTLTVQLHR